MFLTACRAGVVCTLDIVELEFAVLAPANDKDGDDKL